MNRNLKYVFGFAVTLVLSASLTSCGVSPDEEAKDLQLYGVETLKLQSFNSDATGAHAPATSPDQLGVVSSTTLFGYVGPHNCAVKIVKVLGEDSYTFAYSPSDDMSTGVNTSSRWLVTSYTREGLEQRLGDFTADCNLPDW